MPDLSEKSVHQFWHDYDRRTLYRIVASMETIENWTLDSQQAVNDTLNLFGKVLDHFTDIETLSEEDMVKILAHTRSTRALRIMHYLDSIKPGTASKFLVWAENQTKDEKKNPFAEIFLKRNLAFERLQLLGRVFAPERINLVLRALENADE